jgi:hypothetical protein
LLDHNHCPISFHCDNWFWFPAIEAKQTENIKEATEEHYKLWFLEGTCINTTTKMKSKKNQCYICKGGHFLDGGSEYILQG